MAKRKLNCSSEADEKVVIDMSSDPDYVKTNQFLQDLCSEYEDGDCELGVEGTPKFLVDTGNLACNKAISGDYFGGYAGGRVTENFGDSATGKSMFFYTAAGRFQKQFGAHAYVIIDDPEDAYTAPVARKLCGVDTTRIIRLQSETVEEHFEKVLLGVIEENAKKKVEKTRDSLVERIREKDPKAKFLVVLDSLPLLSTNHELAVGNARDDMARAKVIRKNFRMARKIISDYDVCYLVANHVYESTNAMPGLPPKRKAPGGKMVEFIATTRNDLKVIQRIEHTVKGEKIEFGVACELYVQKNRLTFPHQKALYTVLYATGIDRYSGLTESLLRDGIIDDPEVGKAIKTDEQLRELLAAHKAKGNTV